MTKKLFFNEYLNLGILVLFFIITLFGLFTINSHKSFAVEFSVDTKSPQIVVDTGPGKIIGLQNPLKAKNIVELIKAVLNLLVYLGTILAMLLLIWVGFLFISSRGNPGALEKAKNWFLYIIIGSAILFGARFAIEIIQETIKSTGLVDPELFVDPSIYKK